MPVGHASPRDPAARRASVKPSRAASASRRCGAGDRPDLAGQPDLADRHQAGGSGTVADGAGDGEGDRQVGGGLGQPDAADGGRRRRRASRELEPRAPLEHGEHHRDPGGVEAADVARRGLASGDWRDQRLHLGDAAAGGPPA